MLLQGTRQGGINQTLLCGARNGSTEFSQLAPPIWQGGHHVGHWPTIRVNDILMLCVKCYVYMFGTGIEKLTQNGVIKFWDSEFPVCDWIHSTCYTLEQGVMA